MAPPPTMAKVAETATRARVKLYVGCTVAKAGEVIYPRNLEPRVSKVCVCVGGGGGVPSQKARRGCPTRFAVLKGFWAYCSPHQQVTG